jgi:hypothetical protein
MSDDLDRKMRDLNDLLKRMPVKLTAEEYAFICLKVEERRVRHRIMDYDLKKPCDNCPFRRGTSMRLTNTRVREVVGGMIKNGGEFPCHKTIEILEDDCGEDAGYRAKNGKSKHCAGALIFAEKNKASTQMMRICERIGMYNSTALMSNHEAVKSVFDTYNEALKHLTSPQPDELNKIVDKDSCCIQSSCNDKRTNSPGSSKRRRRDVAGDTVSDRSCP